jgi:hypothetical protein
VEPFAHLLVPGHPEVVQVPAHGLVGEVRGSAVPPGGLGQALGQHLALDVPGQVQVLLQALGLEPRLAQFEGGELGGGEVQEGAEEEQVILAQLPHRRLGGVGEAVAVVLVQQLDGMDQPLALDDLEQGAPLQDRREVTHPLGVEHLAFGIHHQQAHDPELAHQRVGHEAHEVPSGLHLAQVAGELEHGVQPRQLEGQGLVLGAAEGLQPPPGQQGCRDGEQEGDGIRKVRRLQDQVPEGLIAVGPGQHPPALAGMGGEGRRGSPQE